MLPGSMIDRPTDRPGPGFGSERSDPAGQREESRVAKWEGEIPVRFAAELWILSQPQPCWPAFSIPGGKSPEAPL